MPANHPDDDRFLRYVLDELDPAEREAVRLHLGECTSCRQQAGQLTQLLTAFRDRVPSPAPVPVLVQLLERQAALGSRHGLHARPLRALAAGIVIAVLAFSAGYLQARRGAGEGQARSRVGSQGSVARKMQTFGPNLIPITTTDLGDLGVVVASSRSLQDSAAIRDSM